MYKRLASSFFLLTITLSQYQHTHTHSLHIEKRFPNVQCALEMCCLREISNILKLFYDFELHAFFFFFTLTDLASKMGHQVKWD